MEETRRNIVLAIGGVLRHNRDFSKPVEILVEPCGPDVEQYALRQCEDWRGNRKQRELRSRQQVALRRHRR